MTKSGFISQSYFISNVECQYCGCLNDFDEKNIEICLSQFYDFWESRYCGDIPVIVKDYGAFCKNVECGTYISLKNLPGIVKIRIANNHKAYNIRTTCCRKFGTSIIPDKVSITYPRICFFFSKQERFQVPCRYCNLNQDITHVLTNSVKDYMRQHVQNKKLIY